MNARKPVTNWLPCKCRNRFYNNIQQLLSMCCVILNKKFNYCSKKVTHTVH